MQERESLTLSHSKQQNLKTFVMPSVYAVIHLDELYVMWPKVLVY